MRLRIARLTLALCITVHASPALWAKDSEDAPARIGGTFLQLWADHWNWSKERWETIFRHLNTLGLRDIYVQWSLYDDTSYYAPSPANPGTVPPVETILKQAADRGMAVHLGLAFHSGFWQNAKPGPALRAYLAEQRRRSMRAAQDMARYATYPAFAGWYISEEIDDLMWPSGEPRSLLVDHLAELTGFLNRLTPGKPVSISGYAGARTDPTLLGVFWRSLLDRAAVSEVLFQDGIGVGNLPLAYLRQYLDAMSEATSHANRDLRVIVEVFRQVEGTFNGRPFRAIPAPFALVLPQIQAAAPYSKGGSIAFTVPEYMTPMGGIEAEQAYLSYLSWLKASHAGQTQLSALASGTPAH